MVHPVLSPCVVTAERFLDHKSPIAALNFRTQDVLENMQLQLDEESLEVCMRATGETWT